MNTKEYISSGILELYVLGQLSEEECILVEKMSEKHIEVKREIHEISISLEKYGKLNAVTPSPDLFDSIVQQLPDVATDANPGQNNASPSSSTNWQWLTFLFAGISLVSVVMYLWNINMMESEYKSMKKNLMICDSIHQASSLQYALIDSIQDPNNKIIPLASTEGFSGTNVYLHYNEVKQKNYLQIYQLPRIDGDHDFQLWSLKPGQDPIPLDVFNSGHFIIPISFEEGTPTYAITIEPKGGSKVPTLDKLIGTLTI
ncbi:MAG: anti-sigma factor [Saprospiraceae bacterium]